MNSLMRIKERINFDKFYLYATLLFAFTLPLSRTAVSFFILLLPIVFILEGNFKSKFKLIWSNKPLQAILLFLAFNLLSLLWSEDYSDAQNVVRLYGYWLVIFTLALSIHKNDIQKIITFFLYGMLLSELIAYGVFFELWSFKHATINNPSPFMFWIDYSVFTAFTSILLLSRLFSNNYLKKEKILMFLFFLSTTGNLFLGLGRTGQVALIVAIVVMIILYLKINFRSILITLALLLSIYGAGFILSDTFKTRVNSAVHDIENIKNSNYDSSWGIRVVYWMITYDILKENPLFGVGIGDYERTIQLFLEKKSYPISEATEIFIAKSHAHNQFLMILIQTGFIGLLLMLNIIYQLLAMRIKEDELKKLSLLFLTIYFASAMAEPLWLKQFTLALFILFIGLFIAANQTKIYPSK
ncbi:MAG: O-antigen ligase family protein [Sulfurimonas sp.]|jgi:O-antigen ligase